MRKADKEELEHFAVRVRAGASREQLMTEFSISRDALYRRLLKCRKDGIEVPTPVRRNWEEDKREAVLVKARENWTAKRIATELGMTENAVSGIISRARLAGKLPYKTTSRKSKETYTAIEKSLRWKETMVGGCRWIEGKLPWEWHWCGKSVVSPDSAYCQEHYNQIHGLQLKKKGDMLVGE